MGLIQLGLETDYRCNVGRCEAEPLWEPWHAEPAQRIADVNGVERSNFSVGGVVFLGGLLADIGRGVM